MRIVRAGSRLMENISHEQCKPTRTSVRNFGNQLSREIVMSRKNAWIDSRISCAAACAVLLSAGSALASQGPGGGMGTASALTQLAMAILVYGASALVIGTGLIGALRRR
jgi:N-acetylglutamate synthase/N-acetylornithine aminotransferase